MKFENKLPSGYTTETIDLDGDKKLAVRLYAAAAAIAVVLTVVCCLLKDISLLFDASGAFALLGRFILVMLITAVCLVGQEYLKCIIIGKLTVKPARVVRGRMSAYIEYKCWLDKRSYLIMSLAPAAAVCLVLLILMIILPDKLFWQCYVIFIVSLTGACGDAYVAYRLSKEKRMCALKTRDTRYSLQRRNN